MSRNWTGTGPSFEIEWGGTTWELRLDDPRPGLRSGPLGPLLSLEGMARAGAWDLEALAGSTLLGFEQRFDRIEATYAPPDWGSAIVRASWSCHEDLGMNLEVQLHALSVGELRGVEVKVLSTLAPPPPPGDHRSVEPRDANSAALSYDGRELDLKTLLTGPPGDSSGPWLAPKSGRDDWTYVEMGRPEDVSRRISEGRLPYSTTRYGLFGYDLEKGVVLRGRLRGFWLPKAGAMEAAMSAYHGFLNEPPPLST